MEQTVKHVRSKDRVPFHCRTCGACCRHIEDQIMLEAYDAYRLGRYLRDFGVVETIEDVYAKYAHPILLSDGFPVFVLNTEGDDHHCVFLRDGRCSVYDARLRVCRLYPFTVKNGDRGGTFSTINVWIVMPAISTAARCLSTIGCTKISPSRSASFLRKKQWRCRNWGTVFVNLRQSSRNTFFSRCSITVTTTLSWINRFWGSMTIISTNCSGH